MGSSMHEETTELPIQETFAADFPRILETDMLDGIDIDALLDTLNFPIDELTSQGGEFSIGCSTEPSVPMANNGDLEQLVNKQFPAPAFGATTAAALVAEMPRKLQHLPDVLSFAELPFGTSDELAFHFGPSRLNLRHKPTSSAALSAMMAPPSRAVDVFTQRSFAIHPSPYALPVETQQAVVQGPQITSAAGWVAPTLEPKPAVSAMDLSYASYSLFSLPPSELPPEVCSALTESLTNLQ